MNAIDEGHFDRVHIFRYRLVRENHELFDDFVRKGTLVIGNDDVSVVIEHNFCLFDVQFDASALFAHGFENIRQFRKQEDHVFDVRIFFTGLFVAVQNLRHFRIGHAVRRTNDRLDDFAVLYGAFFVHPHDA